MLTILNDKLVKIKSDIQNKLHLEAEIKNLEGKITNKNYQLNDIEKQLKKVQLTVTRLENLSITNFLYTIIGKKLEKLTINKEEVEQLQLKYDKKMRVTKKLQSQLAKLNKDLSNIQNLEAEYENLLSQKENYIYNNNENLRNKLIEYTNKENTLQSLLQKYDKAIIAGNEAIENLAQSLKSLDSAKGWSMFDMFGGGFFSTAIKQNHVSNSKAKLQNAQRSLTEFQGQLVEIKSHLQLDIKIDGLLTFADYIFDSFFVDWVVHSQISNNYEKVEKFYNNLNELLASLKSDYSNIEQQILVTRQEKVRLIESI